VGLIEIRWKGVDWANMARGSNKWQDGVKTLLKFQVSYNEVKLLTSRENIKFARTFVLCVGGHAVAQLGGAPADGGDINS